MNKVFKISLCLALLGCSLYGSNDYSHSFHKSPSDYSDDEATESTQKSSLGLYLARNPDKEGLIAGNRKAVFFLEEILKPTIKRHFVTELPRILKLVTEGYKRGDATSFSHALDLALENPDVYSYVTRRGSQDPLEMVGLYQHISTTVAGENGIVNIVKNNIMDELMRWLTFIDHRHIENIAPDLESVVNVMMTPIVNALKIALFGYMEHQILSDAEEIGCCAGCKSGKLSPEVKRNIAMGVTGIFTTAIDGAFRTNFTGPALELIEKIMK